MPSVLQLQPSCYNAAAQAGRQQDTCRSRACAESCLSCVLQTSAIFKLQKADGSPSKVPILILEVRLQDQLGGVRPPAIEAMCNNYTAQILPLMGTPAQANTKLPAVGLEVVGSRLRQGSIASPLPSSQVGHRSEVSYAHPLFVSGGL